MVNWKRHISVLTLTFLFGLPVSGLVCGLLCESASANPATSAHHHHSSVENDGAGAPASSLRVSVAGPLCPDPGGAVLEQVTMAADRADRLSGVLAIALTGAGSEFQARPGSGLPVAPQSEQISPPLTATPLVLRV